MFTIRLVFLALLATGCGAVTEPAGTDVQGGIGDGVEVHAFTRCAGCHGPTGEGTELAPQIRSPHEGYAAWVVRNGRSSASSMGFAQDMPAFGDELGDAALDEIFTFLHSQPRPEDGAGLYERFCGNCHGPDGAGGAVGESAREEADDREDFLEIVRSGEDAGEYGRRDSFMPARHATELSDAEVEKIRAFLLGRG
jgi:mono/diheme cytochrome c family protein